MAIRNLTSATAAAAIIVAAVVFLLSLTAAQSNEWQIITAKNFSSEIRIHPHILLIVTVPWCGESRSLMREISLKLAKERQKYGSLKLMLVYRNVDKVLAHSLGAEEEVTVLHYHHAVSYKYKGSLRVPDILSSVDYLLSFVPEELPLIKINNSEDMQSFLASTDKAVLLLESCGWTSKLLAQFTANKTVQALQIFKDLNKESKKSHAPGGDKYFKHDAGSGMMFSEVEDSCGIDPWVGEFSAENGTSFSRNEDMPTNFGTSCSFTEYKKFESFFSKFIAAARDAYLPPQRQRYAFLSNKLLLSPLSVDVSDLWSLIVSYAGCPGCITKLKEETYLQDALAMHDQPVVELLEDENGLGPSLRIDKPSIVLFVDRKSECKETERKSKEALREFKEYAQRHWKLRQADGQSSERLRKSLPTNKGSTVASSNRLVLSSASDKIKDKMSVVIINDGKYVTLDGEASELQGNSLHEIVTHLLKNKQLSKLSSLAKEAGFQLLSDDIDVKIADVISSQTRADDLDSAESLNEVTGSTVINSPQDAEMEHLHSANVESPFNDKESKAFVDLANKHAGSMMSHQSSKDREFVSHVLVDSKIQASVEADKSESFENHSNQFTGSFFFSDGNNKFLRSLTNDLKVPSIVIIDPISQQHYVFSGETTFNSSSISTLIDHYLSGSLIPYQRSGPLRKVVEMSNPPFVNLDFQEKDSIPSVTTQTFSELVIGSGQPDVHNWTNAWHKDVIVLFSSNWCGFCQRMELVVREVYRALKGYKNLVKCDSESKNCSEDSFKDVILKLPAIYSIDCTLNDCSWILKSTGQREVYPTLLLFPAKKKTVIPFDGNMIVTDIIKFLANHGVSSEHLAKQKGTLWTEGGESDNHDISRNVFSERFSPENDEHVGATTDIMLQNQEPPTLVENKASWNLVVGSFLVASERLNGLNPFSEAKILIMSATPDLGFQGLVINKHISWNNVLNSQDAELLREAPISFGGPVIQEGTALVSLTRSSVNHQYPQVLPGVYFLDQSATIDKIKEIKAGNQSASQYWFFWGYSGWGWEQLYNEITDGIWKLHDGSIEDLQWPRTCSV